MTSRIVILAALATTACESVKNRAVSAPAVNNAPIDPNFLAQLSAGMAIVAQSDVPLRAAASPQSLIREMIVAGDEVHLVGPPTPSGSFLHVDHNGLGGWVLGTVFSIAVPTYVPPATPPIATPPGGDQTPDPPTPPVTPPPPPPVTPPPSFGRSDALALALSGVGYSYWWGGGAWLTSNGAVESNAGRCSGLCPSCTHSGQYGADCSGYVAKVWQVPASNSDVSKNEHPYSTYTFYNQQIDWTDIDRSQLQTADAFVYNANGSGHIFLYVSGDPAGAVQTYESRGCSTGIVYNLRSIDQPYKPIRRNGW